MNSFIAINILILNQLRMYEEKTVQKSWINNFNNSCAFSGCHILKSNVEKIYQFLKLLVVKTFCQPSVETVHFHIIGANTNFMYCNRYIVEQHVLQFWNGVLVNDYRWMLIKQCLKMLFLNFTLTLKTYFKFSLSEFINFVIVFRS